MPLLPVTSWEAEVTCGLLATPVFILKEMTYGEKASVGTFKAQRYAFSNAFSNALVAIVDVRMAVGVPIGLYINSTDSLHCRIVA